MELEKIQSIDEFDQNNGMLAQRLANRSEETPSWEDLILTEPTKRGLIDSGYPFPSILQFQAIFKLIDPIENKDFLVQAHTGMGKTVIYLIALLELMKFRSTNYKKHQCIIVGKTFELPDQINKVLFGIAKYFKHPQLRFNVFMEDTYLEQDIKCLKDPHTYPHILICSLSRLIRLSRQQCIEVDNVDFVVLDQCDFLLEQTDSKQDIHHIMQHIMQRINPNRQLFMFTATLTKQTLSKCLPLMKREHEVIQLSKDRNALHNIKHYYVLVHMSKKAQILEPLISQIPFKAAIIFANSFESIVKLYNYLRSVQFKPLVIHSSMKKSEILSIYDSFRRGVSRILISSDASRTGVDFPRVDCVFNFDFPFSVEQFQYRAARTGRFGRIGRTINLIEISGQNTCERRFEQIRMTQFQTQLKVKFIKLGPVIDVSNF